MKHAETTQPPKYRKVLIDVSHRLESEIEAADHSNDHAGARRHRANYHTVMAQLHTLSADRHRERRGEFLWASRDHLRLAKQCRIGLALAEGQQV